MEIVMTLAAHECTHTHTHTHSHTHTHTHTHVISVFSERRNWWTYKITNGDWVCSSCHDKWKEIINTYTLLDMTPFICQGTLSIFTQSPWTLNCISPSDWLWYHSLHTPHAFTHLALAHLSGTASISKLGRQTHSQLSNDLWNLTSSIFPIDSVCVCVSSRARTLMHKQKFVLMG